MLLQTARGLGHNLHYTISAIINAVVNMLLIVILVWKVQAGLIGLLIALNAALILSGLFFLYSRIRHDRFHHSSFYPDTHVLPDCRSFKTVLILQRLFDRIMSQLWQKCEKNRLALRLQSGSF